MAPTPAPRRRERLESSTDFFQISAATIIVRLARSKKRRGKRCKTTTQFMHFWLVRAPADARAKLQRLNRRLNNFRKRVSDATVRSQKLVTDHPLRRAVPRRSDCARSQKTYLENHLGSEVLFQVDDEDSLARSLDLLFVRRIDFLHCCSAAATHCDVFRCAPLTEEEPNRKTSRIDFWSSSSRNALTSVELRASKNRLLLPTFFERTVRESKVRSNSATLVLFSSSRQAILGQ